MATPREVLAECEGRMKKAVEALERELATIRTGRASPALLERLRVDYYGVPTPLNQLAGIHAPEAHLLVVQPWDRGMLGAVEKAILKSDLGLNPVNDGTVLRLAIPSLTDERREELVKLVRKRVEGSRVALRNIRRDALEGLRGLEKEKAISMDELLRSRDDLQKLIDAYIEEANRLDEAKETEIREG